MMKNIFVTSDQHWNHSNILNFTDDNGNKMRPGFADVDEMNEVMIEKWNSVVSTQDTVWQLGDICMLDYEKFEKTILPRLNGIISMTLGNHDDVKKLVQMRRFRKIVSDRRFDDLGLILSHRPLDKSTCWNDRAGVFMRNVHGHIHHRDSPTHHDYVNVSVEKTNYIPVNIEELRIR